MNKNKISKEFENVQTSRDKGVNSTDWLGYCMPLCCNADLDIEVAKTVFNINPDLYKWGVPSFSVNRNDAAMVNTEMAFRSDGTREKYDKELEKIISSQKGINTKSLSLALVALLPEEICKAAIMACRENNH